MNQSIRFCTTPDGVRLAYAVSGQGAPLVAVLAGIAEGLDNAEIAGSLRLSEKRSAIIITRVFDKICVEHRYQAIVLASDAGLGRPVSLG